MKRRFSSFIGMILVCAVTMAQTSISLLPKPQLYKDTGKNFTMGKVKLSTPVLRPEWEVFIMNAGGEIVEHSSSVIEVELVPSIEEARLNGAEAYRLSVNQAQNGDIVDRENPSSHLELGPIPLKYGYDTNVTGNGGKSSIDPIIYRLADVYLTLAEALYLKPGSSAADKEEAMTHINTIRNRAGLDGISNSEVNTEEKFVEILLKERSHELWCENGQYRADLIRFNKFVEHAETVKGTAYANKNKELYPLPLSAINDGKGLVTQNPGY